MLRLGILAKALLLLASVCLATTASGATSGRVDSAPLARPMLSTNFTEYRQTIWKTGQGLPHDTVQDILQTRDGYLWVATRAGLARFDGVRFHIFDCRSDLAMVSDDCLALAEDRDGSLWIGTTNGLLRFFEGTFHRYATEDGLWQNETRVLCADQEGGVWAGTRRGLNRVQHETVYSFGSRDGFKDTWITCIYQDVHGTLFVGTRYGLLRRDFNSGRFIYDPKLNCTTNASIGAICAVDGGETWYWCAESLYRRREDAWTTFGWGKLYAFTWSCPRFLKWDLAGELWLSSGRLGLERFRNGLFTRYTTNDGLSANYVLCAHVDHEGNLWFGTDGGGLNRWQMRPVTLLTTREGLAHDGARCVCETRDGSVWIGTEDGLSRTQMTAGPSPPVGSSAQNPSRLTFAAPASLPQRVTNYRPGNGRGANSVRALAETKDGSLWVGAGDGLYQFTNAQLVLCVLPDKARQQPIEVLQAAHDGALWVVASGFVHRLCDGQWQSFTPKKWQRDDVPVLLEDRGNNLWLAGFRHGVCRLAVSASGDVGEMVGMKRQRPASWLNPELLTFSVQARSTGRVRALHEEGEGALWIGTDEGLARYKDGQVRVLTPREGLPNDAITIILGDDEGCLWFGGKKGIYRIGKQDLSDVADNRTTTLRYIAFDEADGLLNGARNTDDGQLSGCKTRDGHLWFPTAHGVRIIDPKNVRINTVPPPVVIEEVRLDGDEIMTGNQWSVVNRMRPERMAAAHGEASPLGLSDAPVRLPPGRRSLAIHYTANSLVAPEKVRFKHRLDGLDKEWQEAGTQRVARYRHLPPGQYGFRVIACNNHGLWNETGATFAFYLPPTFYQTWRFYVWSSLALAVGGVGLHRIHLRSVRRKDRLQQQRSLVDERARIARNIHDDLGARLTQLALLSESARKHPGAQAPDGNGQPSATELALETARSLDQVIWAVQPENDDLANLAEYLGQYAQEFLAPSGISLRQELPRQIPPWPISSDVRQQVFRAAKEALNNAVKHARATALRLRLKLADDSFTLSIEDNGCGFVPSDRSAAAGNGLEAMRSRMENVGGSFALRSVPGQGTEITLHVPIRRTAKTK